MAEPLEERVLFALALAAGGSGYSGTLSNNAAIRKQQLVCDPAEPVKGSTSVTYDPKVVHLSGVTPGPGYANASFSGLVEVRLSTGKTTLQPLASFLDQPAGRETGYVQVRYRLTGTAGQIQPPSGYKILDEGGVEGVDTHAFFFSLREGVATNTPTRYSIFAANAGVRSGNAEDFLVTTGGQRLGPSQLSPAFVSSDPTLTNNAPVINSTGGPYYVPEGKALTLRATATDRQTPTTLKYSWDLKADGTVDATGSAPVISAAALQSLGLGDGNKSVNVRLTVSDGKNAVSALTRLTIVNVKPTARITGATGVAGTPTAVRVSASDPSAADRAAGFRYLIDWGDGTTQTVNPTPNNGGGLLVRHNYATARVYTVTLRAVDKNGAVSSPVTALVTIRSPLGVSIAAPQGGLGL